MIACLVCAWTWCLCASDSGFFQSNKYRDTGLHHVQEEASELMTDPVEFARVRMLLVILLVFDAFFVLFDEITDAIIMKEMWDSGDAYLAQFWIGITGIAIMLLARVYLIRSNPYVDPKHFWLYQFYRLWFLIEPKSGLWMMEKYTYARKTGGGDARRAAQAQQRIQEQKIEWRSDFVMIIFEDLLELAVQIWYQYEKEGWEGFTEGGLVTLSISATLLHVFRQFVEIWFDYNTIDTRKVGSARPRAPFRRL